jgi:hydroxymethylpyrimidine kinase/phosphomethylpyrimidine kinase
MWSRRIFPRPKSCAAFLSGIIEEMKTAAKKIHDFGPKNVLIKGGHLKGDAVDLLYDGQSFQTYETPRLNQRNTHGTGCSFSAALATFLGQELEIHEAVGRQKPLSPGQFVPEFLSAQVTAPQTPIPILP